MERMNAFEELCITQEEADQYLKKYLSDNI